MPRKPATTKKSPGEMKEKKVRAPKATKKASPKPATSEEAPKAKRVISPEHLEKLREGRRKYLEKKAIEKAENPPQKREKKQPENKEEDDPLK